MKRICTLFQISFLSFGLVFGLTFGFLPFLGPTSGLHAQEAKKTGDNSKALNDALSRIDRLEAQIVEMQSVIGALQTMVQKNGIRPPVVNDQPVRQMNERPPVQTEKFQTDGWGVDTQSTTKLETGEMRTPPADLPLDDQPPQSKVTLNGQSPQALYDAGYNYMMASDLKSAEATFQAFLSNFPNDQLSGNAQYWLGEVYYVRGDYRRAANEFLKGYKTYKNSPKAPDNLLKLGMSLRQLGQAEAACQTYSELKGKYRSLPGHIDRQLQEEKAKAGCS